MLTSVLMKCFSDKFEKGPCLTGDFFFSHGATKVVDIYTLFFSSLTQV